MTSLWRSLLLPLLFLTVSWSAAIARSDPEGKIPSNHQDSAYLGRVISAVRPPDGLLSVILGGRSYGTVYQVDGFLERVSQKDMFLRLEAGPLPWLQVRAELPYRTWSDGTGWIPRSGSGVGDGIFQLSSSHALLGNVLNVGFFGGSSLPTGSKSAGLTEGVASPHLGGALSLRLWTENQVPEMRLHLNYGQRWNRSEDTGYGTGLELFEPWFPRYQSADAAGGSDRNDQSSLGAAVEFRKGTTSIWVEYLQDRFIRNDTIEPREQYSAIGAGVRWGVMEGWAVRAEYLASLTTDDLESAWDPAYPDLIMEFSVSRQFSIGGADCDNDGIVDRHDQCPCVAEDKDRWQDEDGCPEWDNDGDRIPDELDQAPNAPEDYDGWNDLDGIPDPDNDGDGIFDWLDSCPDEAEDMDGYRDEDGCPDEFSDRDGDGIEDSEDGCPDQPEDLDLFEDGDGCPDLDNDMDGIPDVRDKCPDLPEDYDGVDDEDGCPD